MSNFMSNLADHLVHSVEQSRCSKAAWYREIAKRAHRKEYRKAGETPEMAFTRFITTDTEGQALYAAYKQASGPDHGTLVLLQKKLADPPKTAAMMKLDELVDEYIAHSGEALTREQAFAHVVTNTPEGRKHFALDKRERGILEAMGEEVA